MTARGDESLVFIEQYASKVPCHSSQYGNVHGVSYTANNLIGPPSRFPSYGDFPETYAPRTYGKWWQESPCAPPVLSDNRASSYAAQDFVDVQFQKSVYPYCVNIYETFNTNCVRRLWAGDGKGTWKLLNENPRRKSLKNPQIFSYKPHHFNFLTSIIRIEIDSFLADYYPEIDAVLLVGTERYPSIEESLRWSVLGLSLKVVELGLHHIQPGWNLRENFRSLRLFNKIPSHRTSTACHLDRLPEEILRVILTYLDLRSLCSLACVSTSLYRACKDPGLYTTVNLKPYWYCVNRSTLEWLACRCQCLQYFDISWCGHYGKITPTDFSWFIMQFGQRLKVLRLENCGFLNNEVVYWISTKCNLLQELNFRGCRDLESNAFWHLGKLSRIERLILDNTQIELPTLLVTLQAMSSLDHLSVASCQNLMLSGSLDEIVRWLNRYRSTILSLDLWRSGHLTNQGMEMLVGLQHLKELDIGWCGLPSNGNWISRLAHNCRHLEKLFLTATRVIKDTDLISIGRFCPNLKQLDLLGNSYITSEGCSSLLEQCKNLQLLDVSCCGQIEASHVSHWNHVHPDVHIKRINIYDDD